MKLILRSSLAVATIAGAMAMVPQLANAGVGVSIGIGVPVADSPYGPGYSPYDADYYYDPIYISGAWYHGPYRWRMRHGERVFFVNGGWHRNEWRGGRVPESIVFRNGGSFRGGRYEGFEGSDRINARFHSGSGDMRGDRPGLKTDKIDMRQDRGDIRRDRREMGESRKEIREDKSGDRHDGDNGKNN